MSDTLAYLLENETQFRRARLPALYSDFRPLQTTNPDGYNANIDAWWKGLSNAAAAGALPSHDQLVLLLDGDLLRALDTKEWGRPIALPAVIHEAVKKGEMLPLAQFMSAKESILPAGSTWKDIPWKVITWGFRQIGFGASRAGDKLPTDMMVLIGNVDRASKEVARKASERLSRAERIMPKARFAQEFAHALGQKSTLSADDIEILLRYLSRDKHLVAYDGVTVKLRVPGENEAESMRINQEDSTIASLVSLMEDLNVQIDRLSTRVEELTAAAKEAVARKNKVSALALLKSKKLAEASLTKRTATRSQLEEVYASIEQAQDHVDLVRVMGASSVTLRKLNEQVGGAEGVDEVVEQLREQMGNVNEVGEVIADAGRDAVPIDEDEVDAELAALEKAETDKMKEQELEKQRERDLETAKKLHELQELERAVKAKAEASGATSGQPERAEADALQGLKRMSLEEQPKELEPAV